MSEPDSSQARLLRRVVNCCLQREIAYRRARSKSVKRLIRFFCLCEDEMTVDWLEDSMEHAVDGAEVLVDSDAKTIEIAVDRGVAALARQFERLEVEYQRRRFKREMKVIQEKLDALPND